MDESKSDINRSSSDDRNINGIDIKAGVVVHKQKKAEVYVQLCRSVYENVLIYARSDTSVELGGVLLGNYKEKDGKYLVLVEAAINAINTEATKTKIKFTHETWEYINRIKEEKYPEMKIIGWFHTHPGFGVFLSASDKFIQNNFFNLPWQITYVVDPVQGRHGFFVAPHSKLIKASYKSYIKPRSDHNHDNAV